MKGIDLIKANRRPWLRTIIVVVIGFCVVTCTNNLAPIPEAEYSREIVGHWQGTVGNLEETMSIKSDRTFVCQIHRLGFIANTLSESVPGTISGTWEIAGANLTLRITGAKNEHLQNKIASSTIVSFNKVELVLKSSNGETSTFRRVSIL